MKHQVAAMTGQARKGVGVGRALGVMVGLCFVLVTAFAPGAAGQAATIKTPEHFSATASGQSGMFSGKSVLLNIYVNDYTSDEDAQELADRLNNDGSDALLSVIQKMKSRGNVAVTGYTDWRVPVVRQSPTEKGRRIVLFSGRPTGFYEASAAPQSGTYAFGLLVLNLNDKGEGDGQLYGACQVKIDNGKLEVEHYEQPSAHLTAVKLWK
jgi:hypothetical protein